MQKYIIQFSLFGNNPRYFDALCANIEFVESGYNTQFETSIIIGKGVPKEWVNYLFKTDAQMIMSDDKLLADVHQDFYRIYPVLSGKGLGFFCRDADSFLSKNEMESMKRFIVSDYSYHIIRDHPYHLSPIMAGLFGVKLNGYDLVKKILLKNMDKYSFKDKGWRNNKSAVRGEQEILADYLYPLICKDSFIESNYTIFLNEKSLVAKCEIPKEDKNWMGRIDPKYNPNEKRDMIDYIKGRRTIYLPYWLIKLFRYRYLYRLNWKLKD
jgi:hypothetical protein